MQYFLSIFGNSLPLKSSMQKTILLILSSYMSKMLFPQIFYPLNAIMVCLYFTTVYIFMSLTKIRIFFLLGKRKTLNDIETNWFLSE